MQQSTARIVLSLFSLAALFRKARKRVYLNFSYPFFRGRPAMSSLCGAQLNRKSRGRRRRDISRKTKNLRLELKIIRRSLSRSINKLISLFLSSITIRTKANKSQKSQEKKVDHDSLFQTIFRLSNANSFFLA